MQVPSPQMLVSASCVNFCCVRKGTRGTPENGVLAPPEWNRVNHCQIVVYGSRLDFRLTGHRKVSPVNSENQTHGIGEPAGGLWGLSISLAL